jgi:hypothetical protein
MRSLSAFRDVAKGNLHLSKQDRVIIYRQKGLYYCDQYFYNWPSERIESRGKYVRTLGRENKGKTRCGNQGGVEWARGDGERESGVEARGG